MITPPLVMIDLDHSFDRTTQTITDPHAQEIVEALNSYTETPPKRYRIAYSNIWHLARKRDTHHN
jgi:primase-polymerase (primpol)-like protein